MKKLSLFICLMIFGTYALAQSPFFESSTRFIYLGKSCFHKEDLNRDFDSIGWTKVQSDNLKLNPDTWHTIRFVVENRDSIDRSLLLFLHNAQIDSAYLSIYQGQTLLENSPLTGCNMPGDERPTYDRTLSLPVHLAAENSITVFLHVYGREFEIAVTPQLVDPAYDNDFAWTDSAYFILFLLIVICLFISCTLFYFLWQKNLRTNTFAWFVLYAVFGCLHLLATSGYGSLYIWGSFPYFEVNAAIFSGAICCLALLEMAGIAMRSSLSFKGVATIFRYFGLFYVLSACIGFCHYFPFWPAGYYKALITVSYLGMIIAHSLIAWFFLISRQKTLIKGSLWLGLFYLLHLLFYISIICVENNFIVYDHKLHTYINLIFYIPQMSVVLFYLILNYIAIMEQMKQEEAILKENILTKLYNEVSEPLTKIQLNLHAENNGDGNSKFDISIAKIASDTDLALRQLNDLYFAMKPNAVYISDLFVDLKDWMANYWKGTSMQLNCNAELGASNFLVDPMVKAQLIFIVKEINNNIAKHANASSITFSLNVLDEYRFEVLIGDNGIGMDLLKKSTGHGMEGISSRVKKMGGSLSLKSKPNAGLLYVIVCKNLLN